MGNSSRSRSFSFKRTMAVALAAGLAFNGVQAATPAHLAVTSTAQAQIVDEDPFTDFELPPITQTTQATYPKDDPELFGELIYLFDELRLNRDELKEEGYDPDSLKITVSKYEKRQKFPEWVNLHEDGSFTLEPGLDVEPGTFSFDILVTIEINTVPNESGIYLTEFEGGFFNVTGEVLAAPKPRARTMQAAVGEPAPHPENGIANLSELPHGTKVAWLTDAGTDTIGKKTRTAVVTYPDGSTVNVEIPITVLVNQKDYEDTLSEIKDLQNQADALNKQLNTGLARCVGTVGGSLLALMPAIAIASQIVGGLHYPALDTFIANVQKQIGAFHPGLAKAVDDNRGAIAAAFAGIAVTGLALTPLTCRDASLGEAIAEPLSSN